MAAHSTQRCLLSPFQEQMQLNALRVRAFVSAGRLWERVLTEQEQLRLGG